MCFAINKLRVKQDAAITHFYPGPSLKDSVFSPTVKTPTDTDSISPVYDTAIEVNSSYQEDL